MAAAFCACFFPEDHAVPIPNPEMSFPPYLTQDFYPVTGDEVTAALCSCSNKSAPGPSGTPYTIVWWVHEACPVLLPSLFTAALCLRHHPWSMAKVVIILKLGKADYSAPRAYHP
jgi:hypothetical protein